MRTKRFGLVAGIAVATLVLGAWQGSGSGNSAAASGSQAAKSDLKIGLVTDVGTLDDKNFNQFSWEGAKAGAEAIGAPAPQSVVTTASADYAKNIQSFIDQDYNVIVTVGFALGNDTTKAAKANPDIKFIGVEQGICVDETGAPDPNFGCKGDAAALLPNYQGLVFKEYQPGYLAGVVAASISKSGHIAAIGGTKVVPAVANYMAGYANGAAATRSDVKVDLQYISEAPDEKAFNDPSGGKAFAEQFLGQSANKDVDVLFQVAGKTGNGVLQAACDAKINAIGVDVDQHLSTPEAHACIVTSAEKNLKKAVSDAIGRVNDKSDKGGTVTLDITTDSVGLAPFYDFENLITADIQSKIDAAIKGLKDGSIDPCKPTACV
jgi:basic membrane protein A